MVKNRFARLRHWARAKRFASSGGFGCFLLFLGLSLQVHGAVISAQSVRDEWGEKDLEDAVDWIHNLPNDEGDGSESGHSRQRFFLTNGAGEQTLPQGSVSILGDSVQINLFTRGITISNGMLFDVLADGSEDPVFPLEVEPMVRRGRFGDLEAVYSYRDSRDYELARIQSLRKGELRFRGESSDGSVIFLESNAASVPEPGFHAFLLFAGSGFLLRRKR